MKFFSAEFCSLGPDGSLCPDTVPPPALPVANSSAETGYFIWLCYNKTLTHLPFLTGFIELVIIKVIYNKTIK